MKKPARAQPAPDAPPEPAEHLDEIERSVVKALVTILIREIGEEMGRDSAKRPKRARAATAGDA